MTDRRTFLRGLMASAAVVALPPVMTPLAEGSVVSAVIETTPSVSNLGPLSVSDLNEALRKFWSNNANRDWNDHERSIAHQEFRADLAGKQRIDVVASVPWVLA